MLPLIRPKQISHPLPAPLTPDPLHSRGSDRRTPHRVTASFPACVAMALSLVFFTDLARAQTDAPDSAAPVYKDRTAAADQRAEDLLRRLTPDEKFQLLSGKDSFYTHGIERLGLPSFRMSDGPQGVRCAGPSTAYTAGICLAASWDTDLAQTVGASYGRNARARGVHYLLAPGMNLYRAPMCGRNFEYYGEDPVLSGLTAAAFVRGVQSQGVAATIKHFAANNQEFSRHDLSSDVDERTLRELYLRGFQIALREGRPKCVMNSYNPINGVHATQNSWLNNDVLKGEWGFRGLLMSDWDACYDTLGMANGGLDLEMPSGKYYDAAKLRALLDAGKITQETIDDKVRRQLRVAFEMRWLDRAQQDKSIPLDDPASVAANLDEARGGITLLKNEGKLLPLTAGKTRKIVVLGPNAYVPVTGGGGSGFVTYLHARSVSEALRNQAPAGGSVTDVVWEAEQAVPATGEAGLELVRAADAVVVCVGFNDPGCFEANHGAFNEREEQDRSYGLPRNQDWLIDRVAKVNPHTVVVLNAGGSVATKSWLDHAEALVHAYYPGTEGNTALAEIIFGRTNPSGKLPFSWEKRWEDDAAYGNYPSHDHPTANAYKEGVLLGYRWFDAKNVEPQFPFGFGLTYTDFEFSDLQAVRNGADEVDLSVTVHNAGARQGAEVVQVYVESPGGVLPQPARELKAYKKVSLQAGETSKVALTIKVADLVAWNPTEKRWVLPPGDRVFRAGDSSRHLPLKASLPM